MESDEFSMGLLEMRAVDVPAPPPPRETAWIVKKRPIGLVFCENGFSYDPPYFFSRSTAEKIASAVRNAYAVEVYRDTLEPVETPA